ncbi:MAG: mechanosensitive ion channel [Candidatus Zixiibacteriota bacterium]|nr:MAG: mechanosensitive ion channel [candidate division Zixibacteria bacterium]
MDTILSQLQSWVTFYGLKIVAAIVIFILGRWIAKAVGNIAKRLLAKKNVDAIIVSFVGNLTYVALLTFVIIAALAQLGIQTASFIAVVGAAGLAIGLALQGSLANFAAGFLLVIFRPFKVGDYIDAAGASGTVEEIKVFTTQLRTIDNKTIIIPNARLTGDNITNYSAKDTRRVDIVFGVSYTDDLQKVRQALQSVVEKELRILDSPATAIIVKELADSSVNFEVRAWVKTEDYWDVYFDLVENVKKRFDEDGISIPFPQTDVHMYKTE